ncbi:hypothetical protein PoB_005397300 [Plakobranchus ocellatus]|uniref:Secreted protein n=1 Tax=Plakobranchus ocellatus TaxID=259542 RepID=A0AAV4C7J0_9GAST|nr:hypothetical protein PoB_005397300 [Plakobranchus ocellatus]
MTMMMMMTMIMIEFRTFFVRKSKKLFWGSGGSPGRAVGYQVGGPRLESQSRQNQFIIAPPCLPIARWIAVSLKTRRSTGGEESNGKLTHNAVCQVQSGPYSWLPDAWTKRGTHFTL